MRLLFTPHARSQFLSSIRFIHDENPTAARKLRDTAYGVLQRLLDFPNSGRFIPEFPELPFREVVVPPFRFFYRVRGDAIWVVAAWHSAQLPASPAQPVEPGTKSVL